MIRLNHFSIGQRRQNKIAELEAKVKRTPETSINAAAPRFYSPSPRPSPPTETSLETLLPTPNRSLSTDQQLNVENDWDELISTNESSDILERNNEILLSGNENYVDDDNVFTSSINLDMGINPELVTRANGDQRLCFPSNNIDDGWCSTYNRIWILNSTY